MTLSEMLLVGAVLLALLLLVIHQYRQHRQLERRLAALTQRLDLFQQSLHGLTAGAGGVDKRLAHLEDRERELSERQDELENQRAIDQPYAQAIGLVQQGASVPRLMEELQLSESEAELIHRLHGLQQNDA